jgi:hypothetical protein
MARRVNPQARSRALDVLGVMRRHHLPLTDDLARQFHTTRRTVFKYVRGGLRREGSKWVARGTDQILRRTAIIDPERGVVKIEVRGLQRARTVAAYRKAVLDFRRTGDARVLAPFRRKAIVDSQGRRHEFVTNPQVLRRLNRAGVLQIDEPDWS